MNKHAQKLGRLAAGKPKNYSKAERLRRRERMARAREAKAALKKQHDRIFKDK